MIFDFLFKIFKKKAKKKKKKKKKKRALKKKARLKIKKKKTKPSVKIKIKKAPQKKKTPKKTLKKKEKNVKKIGRVTHYFPKVKAAVIKVTKGPVKIGDTIFIKGTTTDLEQTIDSMQIEHKPITSAKKGDVIGIRIKQKTREGDEVFKEF